MSLVEHIHELPNLTPQADPCLHKRIGKLRFIEGIPMFVVVIMIVITVLMTRMVRVLILWFVTHGWLANTRLRSPHLFPHPSGSYLSGQ